MNKRVMSLIVSGMLVVSMTGYGGHSNKNDTNNNTNITDNNPTTNDDNAYKVSISYSIDDIDKKEILNDDEEYKGIDNDKEIKLEYNWEVPTIVVKIPGISDLEEKLVAPDENWQNIKLTTPPAPIYIPLKQPVEEPLVSAPKPTVPLVLTVPEQPKVYEPIFIKPEIPDVPDIESPDNEYEEEIPNDDKENEEVEPDNKYEEEVPNDDKEEVVPDDKENEEEVPNDDKEEVVVPDDKENEVIEPDDKYEEVIPDDEYEEEVPNDDKENEETSNDDKENEEVPNDDKEEVMPEPEEVWEEVMPEPDDNYEEEIPEPEDPEEYPVYRPEDDEEIGCPEEDLDVDMDGIPEESMTPDDSAVDFPQENFNEPVYGDEMMESGGF